MVDADPQPRAGRGSPRWRSPPSTSRCGISRRGCSACRCASCSGMAHDRVPVYGIGGFTAYSHRAARRAARRLGRAQGIPRVKMKVGVSAGRRSRAGDGARARRSARRPSCSSTPTAPTRASRRSTRGALRRRARRELVRGAGVLRRPRGPAAAARPRAGRDGDRRRRVRLRRAVLPADARGRRGRRAAGRRHPLRRDHRAAAGRRAVPRARPAAVAALRPGRSTCIRRPRSSSSCTSSTSTTTSGSSTCCSTAWSSRATGRSCPDLDAAGQRARAQARGRGALCALSVTSDSAPTTPPSGPRSGGGATSATGGCSARSPRATAFSALPLGTRDLLRALPGVVRRQVDVDAGRALAGADRRRRGRRAAPSARRKTWLPALSALYCLDGVIGVVTHVRGVARKPGGFDEPLFNIVMGPPLLAPGLAGAGRRDGPGGRRIRPRALMAGRDFRDAGHLPNLRRTAARRRRRSCRASATA